MSRRKSRLHHRRREGSGPQPRVRLAEEGADIIAVDIAVDLDMAQTVKEAEALGRRIVADQADVRDYDGLKAVLDDGGRPTGPVSRENRTSGTMRRPSKGRLELRDRHRAVHQARTVEHQLHKVNTTNQARPSAATPRH
jgi:NAD(P)-dependent dehydrogenase (short-subunit alcohol dehydrogenase family)